MWQLQYSSITKTICTGIVAAGPHRHPKTVLRQDGITERPLNKAMLHEIVFEGPFININKTSQQNKSTVNRLQYINSKAFLLQKRANCAHSTLMQEVCTAVAKLLRYRSKQSVLPCGCSIYWTSLALTSTSKTPHSRNRTGIVAKHCLQYYYHNRLLHEDVQCVQW